MSKSFGKVVLGIVILACLAGAYTAVWWFAAATTQRHAELWFEAQRPRGLVIGYGEPTWSGFPTRVKILFPDFRIACPGAEETILWAWRTAGLHLAVKPFDFNTVSVDMSGKHLIDGLNVVPDVPFEMTVANGTWRFTFARDRLQSTSLSLSDVTVAEVLLQPAPPVLSLEKLTVDVATQTGPPAAARAVLTAQAVQPPAGLTAPLTGPLQSVALTFDIAGDIGHGPLPSVLEAWRAGGGTLEVRDFAFDWPPVSATGSGTIALDARLQPEAAFTTSVRGFLHAIDMLAAGGRMSKQEAALVGAGLSLMAKTPAAGGEAELVISVTAQNQKVYAGPAVLMDLPKIEWPKNLIIP